MRQYSKSVSPRPVTTFPHKSCSIYNVFIPPNKDRKTFIEHCLRTNTISIFTEYGEVHHNVPVTKLAMPLVQFENCQVLVQNVTWRNQLYVTDVIFNSDEFQFQDENEHLISQKTDNNISQMSINADEERIDISSISKTGDASVNLKSQSINLKASKQLSLLTDTLVSKIEEVLKISLSEPSTDEKEIVINSTREELRVSINDEVEKAFLNFNQSEFQLSPEEKVLLGQGNEPILLGDTSGEFLNDILEIIKTLKCGPYPVSPDAVTKSTELQNKIDTLKSKYSFTD